MTNYQTLIDHASSYKCVEEIIKDTIFEISIALAKDLNILDNSLSQSPLIFRVNNPIVMIESRSRTSCHI